MKSGDVVNIDVTVIKDGFHGDTSRMFFVGKPNIQAERLSAAAFDGMWLGINELAPGKHLGDVGEAIQKFVEKQRFSVVREYCGHGIGRQFHEDPQVLHYGERGTGLELQAGMTLTVEPMVNAGKRHVRLLPDGLDRGDERSQAISTVGAHRPHHRDGVRSVDAGGGSTLSDRHRKPVARPQTDTLMDDVARALAASGHSAGDYRAILSDADAQLRARFQSGAAGARRWSGSALQS